tara:strand:- start:69 stop:239 length:171 start_codon:yes stop_codon:yes gene_type:complete
MSLTKEETQELEVVLKYLGMTEAEFWAKCDAKVREIKNRIIETSVEEIMKKGASNV